MALVSKRDGYKAELLKIGKWIKNNGSSADAETLQKVSDQVKTQWENFQQVHDQILEVTGVSEYSFQEIEETSAKGLYEEIQSKLDKLLHMATPAGTGGGKNDSQHPTTGMNGQVAGIDRIRTWVTSPESQNATLFMLNARSNLLEKYWTAIMQNDAIMANDPLLARLENLYMDTKGHIDERLAQTNGAPHPQQAADPNAPRRALKLPAIELPKFSGNFREWTSYHDTFTKLVGQDGRLSGVEKLHYLKASLEGEAAGYLSAYRITDANFDVAWTALTNRYQKRREIVEDHLENMFSTPGLSSESATGLRKLVDRFSENMRQLASLDLPTQHWDAPIVYWLAKKLDPETRRCWKLSLVGDNLESFDQLIEFIQIRCRSLEAAGLPKPRQPTTPSSIKSSPSNLRAHISTSSPPCVLCNEHHYVHLCKTFLNLYTGQRYKVAVQHGLCFNCLKSSHSTRKCTSRACTKCDRKHHTLLHYDDEEAETISPITGNQNNPFGARASGNNKTSSGNPTVSKQYTGKSSTHGNSANPKQSSGASSNVGTNTDLNETLLSTAVALARDPSGDYHSVRILLDTGSQSCFISERCTRRLNLNRKAAKLAITGVGASNAACTRGVSKIVVKSCLDETQFIEIEALILDEITRHLPTNKIDIYGYDHLLELPLADPQFHVPAEIDILLGANVYWQIVLEGFIKGSESFPSAQNTTLGWILFGPTITEGSSLNIHTTISLTAHFDFEKTLRQFWEIESLGQSTQLSATERKCEQIFADTHTRDSTGRFIVHLPFDELSPPLGNSRCSAINSMLSLERRFARDEVLKTKYIEFMDEYLALGHMKLAARTDLTHEQSFFIPHHPVFKQGKIRVVFDASRKTSTGISLNDKLLVGPKLQDDLFDILVRFRLHSVAFTCDIAKMYRQVDVHDEHRNYQKIVWRESTSKPILEYDLQTVTYGTASASYLATKSLQQLAHDEKAKYPLASEATLNDFYVDDIMTGSSNLKTALRLQRELIALLECGGMELRKWVSNRPELLASIPADFREPTFRIDQDDAVKTLGLFWHPRSDTLGYVVNQQILECSWTKRRILSEISKLFDPLGLLAPAIIQAKIFMQCIWAEGIDWDDRVSDGLTDQWKTYRNDLPSLDNLRISRWMGFNDTNTTQIHGFCDASEVAYGAVVYLRTRQHDGKTRTNILAAKTKVAPIKKISLPKLELCGALLLAKLMDQTISKMHLEKCHQFAWTDSTVVLAWVRKPSHIWHTFVANRVSEIQSLTPPEIWRHVPGTSNPADLASRGLSPSKLIESCLWWDGPTWLLKKEECWPEMKTDLTTDIERKPKQQPIALSSIASLDLMEKYSGLRRLKRVTALVWRFINNARHPNNRTHGKSTIKELESALHYWIKVVQNRSFSQEIKCCKDKKAVHLKSLLKSLAPFIDEYGLLRVGGRLSQAKITFEQKHPLILPKTGHLTDLIIAETHQQNWHAGTQLTLFTLRQTYWIIGARMAIKKHINDCIRCFRQRTTPGNQMMADLPFRRVQPTRPFLVSGVDYAGPIIMRLQKGRCLKTSKGYIALFVCFATKAIHLEVVSDLTTEAFLAAFRRFSARRGICSDLHSDCGTNFVGADKELKILLAAVQKQANSSELVNILTDGGTNWHFNPPGAPNFGGIWEAGVKSVKNHLRRTLGTQQLTYEELTTYLTQIEACLNSRPIYAISDDPTDLSALTPGHFLIGGPLNGVPDPDVTHLKMNRLNRWQAVQQMVQHFWRRWHLEYLNTLQPRVKWLKKQSNLEVGDLVLVINEVLPPGKWMLGRVTEIFPGRDELARVIKVYCKGGTILRPIHKLRPLPNNRR